ncbi:proteinral RNA polymerase II transcription factor [Pycnococcus provasolii]|uniref:Proteinral RNA polymerase II transcription factor n=1 Tax=Pycnococcus provasolii TaxID=41880 RepID=A0A830HBZ9_9CHLO|nr:proteinral RNA polymerase II transcription factor [Pycnococcus provasolii]|eukprot:CAMPEP_0198713588 /NCGR_PEP_ID=MMETSP1471-20131121/6568_1 /TAXON_ID=41880 /ORGANISM="Pycnococcus provasolii, Strain RCC733" /LENGTH=402 /DNA_ID=CAMNT_0044473693 /DNA_START=30 /DNA_END=1238 /DNA_ORIENTATION=-
MAEHVVVLDSGTDTVKAGFAGGGLDEKEPVLTTPSRAHVYPPGTAPAAGTAPGPQSGGVLACPLSRGAVDRWDVLEAIWHYCVFEQLGWIEGEEGGLMITCPLAWSRRDREVAAQIAFEGLNASSAFLADSGVCSLYSVGKVSGFAVDIGHGKIDVAGVSEGALCLAASETCPHNAGPDLEARLRASATPNLPSDEEGLRNLKEMCARCPVNDAEAKALDTGAVSGSTEYKLPDGRVFSVPNAVGMSLGADLYEPSRLGSGCSEADGDSLGRRIARLVLALPPEQRRQVYDNVVVCGGAHDIPGLKARLANDLKQYSPLSLPSSNVPGSGLPSANVPSTSSASASQVLTSLPEYLPRHLLGVSAFMGAAVSAKVSVWGQNQQITKAEYDEQGPRAASLKCGF